MDERVVNGPQKCRVHDRVYEFCIIHNHWNDFQVLQYLEGAFDDLRRIALRELRHEADGYNFLGDGYDPLDVRDAAQRERVDEVAREPHSESRVLVDKKTEQRRELREIARRTSPNTAAVPPLRECRRAGRPDRFEGPKTRREER
jgi:hypothetical protein